MSEKNGELKESGLNIDIKITDGDDKLSGIIWALMLIWAGIVLLADNFGYLDRISNRLSDLPKDFPIQVDFGAWGLVFLGAAVLLLIEVLIRYTVPQYKRSVIGKLILAMVFMGIGLSAWELIWPMILIIFGLSVLLRARRQA